MNTPFHLDQAISRWRAELNASGSIGSADLAELERISATPLGNFADMRSRMMKPFTSPADGWVGLKLPKNSPRWTQTPYGPSGRGG
jgi:hypothetical protein